jgi:CheY-like chemotaxis protein
MDDDEAILEVTSELLRHRGYLVECSVDGKEALQTYKQAFDEGRPFDLVIMDLTIPGGMGGKEAMSRLLVLDPEALAIVSSGYSDNPVMANYSPYGFRGVMPKPYRIEEMAAEIERVISGKRIQK